MLDYLDQKIFKFRKKTGDYPTKIVMNKKTKDKIFEELKLGVTIDNCWIDKKDNYRNIKIEIKKIETIKLE